MLSMAAAVALVLAAGVWLWISERYPEPNSLIDAVRTFITSRITGMLTGNMAKLLLLVVLVLVLEPVVVGWRNSSLFRLGFLRRRSAVVDLLFFLSVVLSLSGVLGTVFTLGLSVGATGIVNWIVLHYGWTRIALPSDGVMQLLAGFSIYWLATTFFGYWGHRLMHVPWFWNLHRFHHAATELNVITVFRQHPVEPVILNFLSIVSPLVFFNVSEQILLIYFFWATTFDLLAHSQIPWGYGWFGRWIVASPRVHQIHHSVADEHRDMHFSSCPLWDHLFGTWYKGENVPSEYGIPDNQYEVRPFRQFVYDPLAFYSTAGHALLTQLAPRSRIANWSRWAGTKVARVGQAPRSGDNAA
jgi:sterol desaturase/sphingolipid hydroxylase (fatty acid hydroxylase superfamily)